MSFEYGEMQQEIIAQWLLHNLPNLTTVSMSIPRSWYFKFLGSVANHDTSLFTNLRSLHILEEPLLEDLNNPGLTDPELLTSLLRTQGLRAICLNSCVQLKWCEAPKLHAEQIIHRGCGSFDCEVDEFLSICTNLRRFELHHQSEVIFDLSYFEEHKHSLERLDLEVDVLLPTELSYCENLKEISIKVGMFTHEHPRDYTSAKEMVEFSRFITLPAHHLADMLPASLQRIRLGGLWVHAQSIWQHQVLHLVTKAADKFPNLYSIEIDWTPDLRLHKACKTAKISLSVYDAVVKQK